MTPSIKHLDYMGTVKPTGMTSRDCSYSIKRSLQKKEKREKIQKEISHHRIYLNKQLIRKFSSWNHFFQSSLEVTGNLTTLYLPQYFLSVTD